MENPKLILKIASKIPDCRAKKYFKYLYNREKLKEFLLKEENHPNQILQRPKKIAIIFIGTNKYIHFLPDYYSSIKKLFLPKTEKDFFVFTNMRDFSFLKGKKDIIPVKIVAEPIPLPSLLRFRYINKIKQLLKKYSHIIYIDADMYINSLILEKDFFYHDKPLFGLKHAGFVRVRGTFEFNTKSAASVSEKDDLSTYWHACFWGGKTKEILEMTKILEKRVDTDLKNGVMACWHDESHLNKYFIEHKDQVHTYGPNFAYELDMPIPRPFTKKIIHICGMCRLRKSKAF